MLELDLTTIVFEIANFLLLTALLYRFLFRPVMRNVQARTAEKERLAREMEQDRQAAATLKVELEAQLAQADEHAAAIIVKALNGQKQNEPGSCNTPKLRLSVSWPKPSSTPTAGNSEPWLIFTLNRSTPFWISAAR